MKKRQQLFIAPEIVKKFGASVNMVASLICLLSKDGKQSVFATEDFLSERTCLVKRTIAKAKKILNSEGYVVITTSNKGFRRSSTIQVTQKLVDAFDLSDDAHLALSTMQKTHDDNDQHASSTMNELHHDNARLAFSDDAHLAFRNKKQNTEQNDLVVVESSTTIPARETTVPRYYDDIPDPDYDEMFTSEPDTYEADQGTITAPKIAQNAQEGINAPRTINYQSTPNTAPPTQYTSEIEGYSNTSPYNIPSRTFVPQSPEEVIPLIDRFKASRKNERVFEKIDVRYYAWKIFDNYFRPFENSQGGEWVDRNNYVVPPFKIFGKISSWITKDQQAGKLALIQPDLEANKRYLEKICEMTDPARFKKQQTAVEAEFEVIDEQDKTQSTGTALRWPPSKPKTPEEEQKELERIKEVVKWM